MILRILNCGSIGGIVPSNNFVSADHFERDRLRELLNTDDSAQRYHDAIRGIDRRWDEVMKRRNGKGVV